MIERQISFYRDTPYFAHWSRTMLYRLCETFQPLKVKKDQVILEEGVESKDLELFGEDAGPYLYLIKNGDFELTKKISSKKVEDIG